MAKAPLELVAVPRWWLKSYLLGVVIMAKLTGCQPSRARMRYWVDKGIKIEMR